MKHYPGELTLIIRILFFLFNADVAFGGNHEVDAGISGNLVWCLNLHRVLFAQIDELTIRFTSTSVMNNEFL
jgi:hypothetical protein